MIPLVSSNELYEQYRAAMRRIADIKYATALQQWDQEVYLPAKGADLRGQQTATLTELAHELFVSDKLGDIVRELQQRNDLSATQKRNVELTLEDYTRSKKFTADFVRRMSETVTRAFHAWTQARQENDFSLFRPALDALLQLKKQEAEILGYSAHPYDALVNDYEKGMTVKQLDGIFDGIKAPISALLAKIAARPQVEDAFLQQHYPKNTQWDAGMEIIRRLGFDFEAGRQDISTHPFTTSFNNCDVRITTRIDEKDFGNMMWSCIHETGHALYEQGLPGTEYGLPLSEAASFSIHESQSRLWENNVGRGYGFWKHHYVYLQQCFPTQLGRVSLTDFYRGINKVQPSLVRTEADEVTYHFHVMIRYEIEKQLLDGTIDTHEIPAVWNVHYEQYLGVKVPDDRRGCLQDVHWSHGSFGYFPTYSLGSMYAAQFFHQANLEIPGLNEQIETGDTRQLLLWLREKIHQHGRRYTSNELCRLITGSPLNPDHFTRYVLDKYKKIYTFEGE
jgi:carboxypeptidase Taq